MAGGVQPPPTEPDLTVVICTLGKARIEAATESVAASARAAGRVVGMVVVWQGAEPPPSIPETEVIDVFPLGLSYARNRGLAVAGGGLVGFVDDDEVVDESWVAAAVAELTGDDSPHGAFGPVLADHSGEAHYFAPGNSRIVFTGTRASPWRVGTGGNMVFRREALTEVGGFDPRFGAGAPAGAAEETDLVLRLLGGGRSLVFTPELRVYHPVRSGPEELRARSKYAYGMGAALRRSPALSGRYLYTIGQELGRAARSRNRTREREVLATSRGFLAGLVSPLRSRSPKDAEGRLPPALLARLDGETLKPLGAKIGEHPHLRYAAGDRVLHVHVDPAPGLVESVRSDGAEHVLERDALWVLKPS